MFFDPKTVTDIAPDDTQSIDEQSVQGFKEDCVGFNNPMYGVDNHDNLPNGPDNNDSVYEYIERRDTTASNGIYEELPESFENVYENGQVQKSIYNTLKSDADLNSFQNDTIYEYVSTDSTLQTSIYNTLGDGAELQYDIELETDTNEYNTLQRNQD